MPVPKAAVEATQELFFSALEGEMRKIQDFTAHKVASIREILGGWRLSIESKKGKGAIEGADELSAKVVAAGEDFLKLEKFVNLNFTGE